MKQLITGSTGLDDAEWGVTLFAHDTFQIKAIVYQMRFDEVSAAYADFGEFYIGIQLPSTNCFAACNCNLVLCSSSLVIECEHEHEHEQECERMGGRVV